MKTETSVNLTFTNQIREKEFETFLVYCGHNWGRGKTLSDAIKAAKVHPANEFGAYLYKSDEPIEAWVTESGNCNYETETDLAKVQCIEIGDKIKNWFSDDAAIDDLWQCLCSAIRKQNMELAMKFEDNSYKMLEKYLTC